VARTRLAVVEDRAADEAIAGELAGAI
jgi:hypothetical protein